MNIESVKHINKMNLLHIDLEKRKYRAMTYCNPNLSKEFSPQCVIIWKSIKHDEQKFKNNFNK